MSPKVSVIIGIGGFGAVAIILIIGNMWIAGFCSYLGNCDSEIVITSVDYPESVPNFQEFEVKFTVNNIGGKTEKNCILHLNEEGVIPSYTSSPFYIESGEKINITLEHRGFKPGTDHTREEGMVSWVVCDNIESHRNNFKIYTYLLPEDVPFSDIFNSDNT